MASAKTDRTGQDGSFAGYSRASAGSYHERLAENRSRTRLIAAIVIALTLLAALVCGLTVVLMGNLG